MNGVKNFRGIGSLIIYKITYFVNLISGLKIMSFYIRMNEWLNKPVRVLITSKERGLLVLVTGLFTVIFMNLYLPFNISRLH